MKKIFLPVYKLIYLVFVTVLRVHRVPFLYKLVKDINGMLVGLLRKDSVQVLGHTIFLDAKDSLWLSINGVYEPELTALLPTIVRPGARIIDIGANIGYYTLQFARAAGGGGRVFAFEPDAENFRLLKKNLEVNGYKNVEAVRNAVSSKPGSLRLYISHENMGDHRVYPRYDGQPYEEIEAVSLDQYFKDDAGRFDLVKMDIQGAEMKALEGMTGLLERNTDIKIMAEFCPSALKLCGSDPAAFLGLLVKLGFKLYTVGGGGSLSAPQDPAALLERVGYVNDAAANLYCSR